MDYYALLGVERTADADTIKRAYRKLASQHHPDKGGDTAKFQEIEQAYRVLSDPAQRQQYDNPNPFFNQSRGGHSAQFNFNDIFEMFGAQFQDRSRNYARMSLWITLQDVANPGPRLISVGTSAGTQTIEIQIPTGINDGDNIQYTGLAPGGQDLVVNFRIKPDSNWQRQGDHLITNLTATVWQLVVGAEVPILDIKGNKLMLTIPPQTQMGAMLRVKGRGLPNRAGQHGDMMVRMNARIPQKISPELITAIQNEINK